MNKKRNLLIIASIISMMLFSVGCSLDGTDPADDGGNGGGSDTVIDIVAVLGVTAPAGGETPVTAITETAQYTGTVSWTPADAPFEYETAYTATITLNAKSGYTLTGVPENYFTVAGSDTVMHAADSGVVTAVFPPTGFEYAIGDPGPADGIIFYIDTADEHSWTYLEVAPASTEWSDKEWGDYGTEIGGNAASTGIGDGQAATDAIVKHLADNTSETDRAAQLCDALEHEYDGTTYDDWFLPSEDELNAIWDNLVDDGDGNNSGVGGFSIGYYWSSSEFVGNTHARAQTFTDGYQNVYYKHGNFRVRAVRAF